VSKRALIVQVAGLGHDFLVRQHGGETWHGLRFEPADTVFPALTCPVQASFRTALPPAEHGMVFNGTWSRALRRPAFWEQSSALVEGPRIWESLRAAGATAGLLFWQQSLGEDVDVLLSPAPIHKHHGGMIDDVYARPAGLYEELCRGVGRRFKLRTYWGPLASAGSSRWIAAATAELVRSGAAPDLLLTYLPHLDYALLRHGPSSGQARRAFHGLLGILAALVDAVQHEGYEVVIFGDYAFADARRPLYPNRLLAERGLLATRNVRGMLYPDFHTSRAFAVVDHEVAHVYCAEPERVADLFRGMDGVAEVQAEGDLVGNPNAGELVLVAEEGAWFAYPWWHARRERPDYATHVDIHNKPGFDPCELFFGWPPPGISTNARRVGGSHGRTGEGRAVAWASSFELGHTPTSLIELADAIRSMVSLR
jgi:predicted AlkP superfamily pyrophosphatase or phosphodiesterase